MQLGNSFLTGIAYYPGNPTGADVSSFNCPAGTLVIDYSTPAIWLKVSALGSNATFIGGGASTLTAPLISGGLTASGSAANDFSGSTGQFLTSQGLNIFGGGIVAAPQALSGAGAVNLTTLTTKFTSTGASQALTLANGTNGQLKIIVHAVDGGSGILTPSTATGFTTLTFTAAGDSAMIQYFTTQGWMLVGTPTATAA